MNQDSMTSSAQDQEYLEKQGYLLPDAQGSEAMLTHLHPAAAGPLHSPDYPPQAMRVVTIILEHEEASNATNTIAVMHKLNPVLDLMDHAADTGG